MIVVNPTIYTQSYEGQLSFNMFNSWTSISEQQVDNDANV